MNSLSKLQALMWGFLLLIFAALLVNTLLLAPAALLFALQLVIAKSELKRDYPEDWVKYTMVFLFYELVILALVYITMRSVSRSMSIGSMYMLFGAILVIVIITMSLKFIIGRRYCYGNILFTAGEWAGVKVKSDLFSKINEADYAVRNPLGLKPKKGARVRIRVKSGFGKSIPYELAEVVK